MEVIFFQYRENRIVSLKEFKFINSDYKFVKR